MSGGEEEDRVAFEQYMMGASTVTANVNDHTDDTQTIQDQEHEKEQQRNLQKSRKECQSDKIHWILQLDDQAYHVVQALVRIRTRLTMHARLLKLFQQDRYGGVDTNNDADVDGEKNA